MNRLGLDKTESRWLIENKHILEGLNVHFIMSHLSSGELPHDKENKKQLLKFQEIRTKFPKIPASLANSGGCLLGPEYHFQMTRIGIALYGIDPRGAKSSRLEPALKWHARILQVRSAEIGDRVGYNGTFELTRPSRIATIGVGYADGYHRKLGGRATIKIGKCVVPVIGRVSMDRQADITDLTLLTFKIMKLYSFIQTTTFMIWQKMRKPSHMK